MTTPNEGSDEAARGEKDRPGAILSSGISPVGIRPVGDLALLIDVGSTAAAMAWHGTLRARVLPGQVEVVAAARTLLLRFDSAAAVRNAAAVLPTLTPAPAGARTPREHSLDVIYDGEDLDATAHLLGISEHALIDEHSASVWRAAFGGFAPGFAYCLPAESPERSAGAPSLAGPQPSEGPQPSAPPWDVPRLPEPRTGVPAGAVALAGAFSAVYPRRSPGGWRLIGRTDAGLWDPSAEPPALLAPGDTVRYRPVREFVRTAEPKEISSIATDRKAGTDSKASAGQEAGSEARAAELASTRRVVLTLEDPGILTLIEDGGRPGRADIGVSPSGFADRASARAANAVVGNTPDAPVLEVMGAARLTCLADVVVAVSGSAGGPWVEPRLLRVGDPLVLDPLPGLARTYVALRAGVVADEEVGSASADVLSGLGPGPLFAGAEVAVATRGPVTSVGPRVVNPGHERRTRGRAPHAAGSASDPVVLQVVPGPRDDWFSDDEVARFTSIRWQVGEQSNRVGLRLAPAGGEPALQRSREGELASEGTVQGAIQVPPSGEPVVFGPDHPVTGGYPVIATVVDEDLDALAQLQAGAHVRFAPTR